MYHYRGWLASQAFSCFRRGFKEARDIIYYYYILFNTNIIIIIYNTKIKRKRKRKEPKEKEKEKKLYNITCSKALYIND